MKDEEKWPAMHAYRKAVALGEAPAILCPDDDAELVPILGRDSDPELRCLACGVVYDIGLDVWDQIRANLSEVVINIKEKY